MWIAKGLSRSYTCIYSPPNSPILDRCLCLRSEWSFPGRNQAVQIDHAFWGHISSTDLWFAQSALNGRALCPYLWENRPVIAELWARVWLISAFQHSFSVRQEMIQATRSLPFSSVVTTEVLVAEWRYDQTVSLPWFKLNSWLLVIKDWEWGRSACDQAETMWTMCNTVDNEK